MRRTLAGVPELVARVGRQEREAQSWMGRLREQPPGRQYTVVASARGASVPAMVDLLIEACNGHLSSDIEKAIGLGELAVEVALRLDPEVFAGGLAGDFAARAWVALARAKRRAGYLREARRLMSRAREALEAGTGDPLELGRLLEENGLLLTFQGRFQQAVEVLEKAARLYRRSGERHAVGRTLVRLGTAYYHAMEPERGIAIFERAAALLDPTTEPRHLWALYHNLVQCYVEVGRTREGLALLGDAAPLYARLARPADLLKVRWTLAKVLHQQGRLEAAAEQLLEAQQGFVELHLPFEAACAGLEVALVYRRMGRSTEVRQKVLEIVGLLEALEVEQDLAAALICLREATQVEVVSAEALARAVAALDGRSQVRS